MPNSGLFSAVFFILCLSFQVSHNLQYDDLEAMSVSCPKQDKCDGREPDISYPDTSCECDAECAEYGDCCIDYPGRRNSSTLMVNNRLTCVHIGEGNHTGVYAIAKCGRSWRNIITNNSEEVRRKCEGPVDMRDPFMSTPVLSVSHSITYKNRYCAECNHAVMTSLKYFQVKVSCEDSLPEATDDEIREDITYSRRHRHWGIYRINHQNRIIFHPCEIIFDAPPYLNESLRFCRSNLISTCPLTWNRPVVEDNCKAYMAVVYDEWNGYRNPHCAICNNIPVTELNCKMNIYARKRPMSFALLLDVNQSDGDQVGMTRVQNPQCPANHVYDPFFRRCKRLACAVPGTVLVNGKCVRR